MSTVSTATADTFHADVIEAGTPVLVDFWAEWCGPCRQMAPVLEEIAAENSGALSVLKLNVDEHPEIAVHWGISSIPTLKLFVGGQVAATIVGAQPKADLYAALKPHL